MWNISYIWPKKQKKKYSEKCIYPESQTSCNGIQSHWARTSRILLNIVSTVSFTDYKAIISAFSAAMTCVFKYITSSSCHSFPSSSSSSFLSTLIVSLFLPLLHPSFHPSGVGRQQEASQAEANRGEPGAPSEGGTAEDGVGPTGAHPGGVGPHPYGDWGPYGHECPGQPLEAEAEIPGETSSSSLPSDLSLHCIDYPASFNPPPLPYLPLPPVPDPFQVMPLSPPPPPQPLCHCSLC